MKTRFIGILALLLAAMMLFSSCGGEKASTDEKAPVKGNEGSEEQKDEKKNSIEGNNIFGSDRFEEMLWGAYEASDYTHTGSQKDALPFIENVNEFMKVKYGTVEREVAVLPVRIQFGQYTHYMKEFTYDGKTYSPFTEDGRTMFRKAYVEQHGDMTEEDFLKIENNYNLYMAETYFPDEKGSLYIKYFVYEVKGDKVTFYGAEIGKDGFEVSVDEEPSFTYDFLHDGGKLIFSTESGVQSAYQTMGYKESASMASFRFNGYEIEKEKQYKGLEGFYFTWSKTKEEPEVYVTLSEGKIAQGAKMELDKKTGKFTLSWESYYYTDEHGKTQQAEEPTEISGVIVPIQEYKTSYSGFFMFVDGKRYDYLMSLEEYNERLAKSIENAEKLSDNKKEELANKQRDILAELVAAFKKEGIEATVDYSTGQVSLKSNFLFGTDSAELSQKGKDYIDSFMRVYTSVVLKEEYAEYISKIVVEGHTDTSGSYNHNMTLSQKRAESVVEQCIAVSSEIGSMIQAQGCSYDYPVYNENGTVNMEQSRRVTFRFVLSAN